MKIFSQKEKNFVRDLKYFLKSREEENTNSIDQKVREIINKNDYNGRNNCKMKTREI